MNKIVPLLLEKPWGGAYIGRHYKTEQPGLGEARLLSTIEGGESSVDGQPLSAALKAPLKFVVKVLDAAENLALQVHPNDKWAKELENARGRTQCWLILDSKPGAGVYLGLKKGTDPATYEAALTAHLPVDQFLQFFEVKKGDFIIVPAGTVHAIGGGVTLLEVQQASGITYRLWDWNRMGRELHIEKGLKVSNYQKQFEIRPNIMTGDSQDLLKHADFECSYNQSRGEGWFIDLKTFDVTFGERSRADRYIFVR